MAKGVQVHWADEPDSELRAADSPSERPHRDELLGNRRMNAHHGVQLRFRQSKNNTFYQIEQRRTKTDEKRYPMTTAMAMP